MPCISHTTVTNDSNPYVLIAGGAAAGAALPFAAAAVDPASQRPALLQPVAALEAVPAAQQPALLQPVAVLTTAPAGQRFAAVEGQSQRCAQPFAQPAAVQGSTKLEAGNLVLQHST